MQGSQHYRCEYDIRHYKHSEAQAHGSIELFVCQFTIKREHIQV